MSLSPRVATLPMSDCLQATNPASDLQIFPKHPDVFLVQVVLSGSNVIPVGVVSRLVGASALCLPGGNVRCSLVRQLSPREGVQRCELEVIN